MNYLRLTNRTPERIDVITQTLKNQGLLRDYNQADQIQFTDVLELDLSAV